MTINAGETRGEWIDRLSKQIISLEGRGRMIDDEWRLERLLSGMITNDQFNCFLTTLGSRLLLCLPQANILHSWEKWSNLGKTKKISEKSH
jgi:hypothetical protein